MEGKSLLGIWKGCGKGEGPGGRKEEEDEDFEGKVSLHTVIGRDGICRNRKRCC